jgi:hypothetical protein
MLSLSKLEMSDGETLRLQMPEPPKLKSQCQRTLPMELPRLLMPLLLDHQPMLKPQLSAQTSMESSLPELTTSKSTEQNSTTLTMETKLLSDHALIASTQRQLTQEPEQSLSDKSLLMQPLCLERFDTNFLTEPSIMTLTEPLQAKDLTHGLLPTSCTTCSQNVLKINLSWMELHATTK